MKTRTTSLLQHLEGELQNIPIQYWEFFYPCHVAVWRFIRDTYPGLLGDLHTGFDEEPYFRGRGSDWFCNVLGNDRSYLEAIERLMKRVLDGLPSAAKDRGFVVKRELPELSVTQVGILLSAVEAKVKDAR